MKQIPNIEGTHNTREWEKEFDEQFKGAVQLKNRPDGVTVTRLKHFIHQQLQKARQDWLREEIVRLEGMKMCTYIAYRYPDAYVAEISYDKAIQTIIDRYQTELDHQPDRPLNSERD